MNNFTTLLQTHVSAHMKKSYGIDINEDSIIINTITSDYNGDYALVLFPFTKHKIGTLPEIANSISSMIDSELQSVVKSYEFVKGFLNITLTNEYWNSYVNSFDGGVSKTKNPETYLVEYLSPNTNKPLHLGHLRNLFLGDSVCNLLEFIGHKVIRANLYNDKGIHICKSMLAWQKWGNGDIPTSNRKGDRLVGDYYVMFDKMSKENPQLIEEAHDMYCKWESGDKDIVELWKMMNEWVYEGINKTLKTYSTSSFNKNYYESETWTVGKNIVFDGLSNGTFYQKEDGSVWAKIENKEDKLLLRADGTSVYMTQDMGTAALKHTDHNYDHSVYVIGNEQNHHMENLKEILSQVGMESNNIHHLSYGMVNLPNGKMKSREGTVVDADDLFDEVYQKIEQNSKINNQDIHNKLTNAALKYHLLKVDPKKEMTFDPDESIDIKGDTGVFVQYTCARINGILRKVSELNIDISGGHDVCMDNSTKKLLLSLSEHQNVIALAAKKMNPSIVVNYVYKLAKAFNYYYNENKIVDETNLKATSLNVLVSKNTLAVLSLCFNLLGISAVEKM